MATETKSKHKKLQRQLEFYLSESNLRQDKFLQQAMDEHGFVPVKVFLSFNKLKILKGTKRLILEAAEKSSKIRVDRLRTCIAPIIVPSAGQSDDANSRTIYIDSFSLTDDHESLRQFFAQFGKVDLVSLPRFPHNKKFKGFGFIEFSDQEAADAVVSSSGVDMKGIRVMSKLRWLEMKKQLKHQLCHNNVAADIASDNINSPDEPNTCDLVHKANTTSKSKTPAANERVHFGDDGIHEEANGDGEITKKQKV